LILSSNDVILYFHVAEAQIKVTVESSVSDPGPVLHWIRIRLAFWIWIRIQEVENQPKLRGKTKQKDR
jgi:hypothetical protein